MPRLTAELLSATVRHEDRNGTERCEHDMVAAWCADCREAIAAAYGCGTEEGSGAR